MQVAYDVDAGRQAKGPNLTVSLRLPLQPEPVELYRRSYLGLGLMAMRAKIAQAGAHWQGGNPCVANGSQVKLTYAGEHLNATGNANFSGCVALLEQILFGSEAASCKGVARADP